MDALHAALRSAKPGDFGIIGDPVDHSLSPAMQNAALAAWWRDRSKNGPAPIYHRFPVTAGELPEALPLLKQAGLSGLNVTVPHKIAVARLVRPRDFAAEVGAVNTIVFGAGGMEGFNTDGPGFERAVREDLGWQPEGAAALVLGAGGTGKVFVHRLAAMKVARVYWWNRNPARVEEERASLPASVVAASTEDLPRVSVEASLIVNATSVGLREADPLPADGLRFRKGQAAFDAIYHRETAFLRAAGQAGARRVGGLSMLLYQGALAFEIWTGARAPVEIMRAALTKTLEEKGQRALWQFDT